MEKNGLWGDNYVNIHEHVPSASLFNTLRKRFCCQRTNYL